MPGGRATIADMTRQAAAGTLITVAPTGAESSKAAVPTLPVTLEELLATATACRDAGAAVIHVHVRGDDAEPTLDPARLRDTVAALRAATDLVVQLSTGGAVTDSAADRLRVLDALPDAASLTCGTVNFGSDVFWNAPAFMDALYVGMQERGIVPELECFDLGHVTAAARLVERHGPPAGGHVHVDLVLGVPGGMAGDAATVADAVRRLPAGATFSATGVGRTTLPVLLAALAHGGHLRVGMEDTLTWAAGEPVRDNAQLVGRAADLARLAQRPPLTPVQARELLGVPDPS